ncbi:MAG: sodium:alanine symporter family protein [Treponema sp.]|jgi:AGCS family alanine or glycine:cation symporter|nr:sodium:alanine symporter family protein [Treponema sp.]
MEWLANINDAINGLVWGPPALILIVGTGIFITFGVKFIQVGKFGHMWGSTIMTLFKKGKDATAKESDGINVTPFQAVCTALASTVGVGNIAGVAGAIAIGGPGAIFWMWVSAFFGMATKYSEIVLALKYRQVEKDGAYHGGPMYYIEQGIGGKGQEWKGFAKVLAVVFAIFGGLACFGIGNATQAGEISVAVNNLTGSNFDSSLITGIILALIVGAVIIGGIKRIGTVTSYLVPFMSIFYIICGSIIILMNITQVPAALLYIVQQAFSLRAVGSGVFGYAIMVAMRRGIARGVFSNEAGLGSAPIAHAASSTKDPVKQGLWGIFEVFVDTIIICTITGLVVVLSLRVSGQFADGAYVGKLVNGEIVKLSGGALTASAFGDIFTGGDYIVRLALLLFALSTILGWSYYGERCWGYLSNNNKAVNLCFRIVFVALAFVGAVSSSSHVLTDTSALELAWDIADTLNGLMAIPNLIGLIVLSGVTFSLTKKYFQTGSSL